MQARAATPLSRADPLRPRDHRSRAARVHRHARGAVSRCRAGLARAALALLIAAAPDAAAQACLDAPGWHTLEGTAPKPVPAQTVLAAMARRDVVLLGEHHDDADHHRWQLQTLAALLPLRPRVVIGFEAFPRRVQPVLDQWVAGTLAPRTFLARAEWEKVWSFPSELYMPLFEFARLNRIPMLALNVERRLTSMVRAKGWDAVPLELREGVSRPASAAAAYEDFLFEVFRRHEGGEARAVTRADHAFRAFVEAQTTWDRAMAEAIASRLGAGVGPRPLVVAIVGAGHVRHGHGVAHQLRSLGITNVGALLPADADADCGELARGLADAVFALPRDAREPPQRLGVRLESIEGAVRIAAVEAGSLGERSGLRAGDELVAVAGRRPAAAASLVRAVRGAAPGTWLPIELRRAGQNVELVIKFPPD